MQWNIPGSTSFYISQFSQCAEQEKQRSTMSHNVWKDIYCTKFTIRNVTAILMHYIKRKTALVTSIFLFSRTASNCNKHRIVSISVKSSFIIAFGSMCTSLSYLQSPSKTQIWTCSVKEFYLENNGFLLAHKVKIKSPAGCLHMKPCPWSNTSSYNVSMDDIGFITDYITHLTWVLKNICTATKCSHTKYMDMYKRQNLIIKQFRRPELG